MNEQLIRLTQQLLGRLEELDPEADRETLVWAHGFMAALMDGIEASIPTLRIKRLKESSRAERKRDMDKLASELALLDEGSDSLDQTERELGGEEPPAAGAGVPAKRKPGPRGLSGGVALPLP